MRPVGSVPRRHRRGAGRRRRQWSTLGLASLLPIDEPVTAITDFPAGMDAEAEGLALPVGTFSRPVLRTRVVLDPDQGTTSTVFVAHLKLKRPIGDPQAPEAALCSGASRKRSVRDGTVTPQDACSPRAIMARKTDGDKSAGTTSTSHNQRRRLMTHVRR